MKKKVFLFFLIILFSITIIFLFSEVIVLNNGDVIRGKLIKMDEDTMTVLAKYGEIVLDRADIDEIYKDEEAYNKRQSTLKTNTVETEKKEDKMILVKGGTFIMGDTFGGGGRDEKPIHNVTVNDFYISKYEVTFEEFDEYCDDLGFKKKSVSDELAFTYLGDKDYKRPVWDITWYEAIEYCNWLSEKEGLTKCYTIDKINNDPNNKNPRDKLKWEVECNFNANGYRLPTEEEWEYAARGGNESKGYKYAGKNRFEEVAQYGVSIAGKAMYITSLKVGSKLPNELGIYDMSGNLWEWCWDWYNKDYYKDNTGNNPKGPKSGKSRVLRGGSWNSDAFLLRVTCRKEAIQNDSIDHPTTKRTIGFRIVRSSK